MIYDTLDHADHYADLHPLLAEAFAFLRSFDPATPDGRIELRGDDLFVNVERYTTQPPADRRYEAHRRYLDVQTICLGEEAIYTAPLGRLDLVEPHNDKNDVAFYSGEDAQRVVLFPNDFAVFLPQDGHKPVCQVAPGKPREVLKVVAKIRLAAI